MKSISKLKLTPIEIDFKMKNNLIEKYPNNYKLRAFVSLLPNIGGALDILLSEKGSKWREKRLIEFLTKLETRIENLESDIST
jgi:hypothetical protein